MKLPKEFAIVFYGLAMGFFTCWLLGFAVGYHNFFVPVILFGLVVFFIWYGRKLER